MSKNKSDNTIHPTKTSSPNPHLIVHACGEDTSVRLSLDGELWRIDLGDSDYAEGAGFNLETVLDAASALFTFRRLLDE